MPIITDEFRAANHYEAALWFSIGVVSLFFVIRRKGHARSRCAILFVAMIAFGFSDLVEATTGAWWRPWWLLVWKAICVAVFALLLVEHYRRRFRLKRQIPELSPSLEDIRAKA